MARPSLRPGDLQRQAARAGLAAAAVLTLAACGERPSERGAVTTQGAADAVAADLAEDVRDTAEKAADEAQALAKQADRALGTDGADSQGAAVERETSAPPIVSDPG